MIRVFGGHCAHDYAGIRNLSLVGAEDTYPCETKDEDGKFYAFRGSDDPAYRPPQWATDWAFDYNCGPDGYFECRLPSNMTVGAYNVSYNVINHGECVGGPGAYGAYDYAHGAKEEYAVRYGMLLVALVPTPEPTPVPTPAPTPPPCDTNILHNGTEYWTHVNMSTLGGCIVPGTNDTTNWTAAMLD
jgi:hypothetical protein